MFICAAWRRLTQGHMQARRTLVLRCDLSEGHEGQHVDQVLGVNWADEDSDPECQPRNELKNLEATSLTDGLYVVARKSTQVRSIFQVSTCRYTVAGRERVDIEITGIGDDNGFFSFEDFFRLYLPICRIDPNKMSIGSLD